MADDDKDQERTEQPTSRRREQARQEGSFATSREVSTLFMISAGIVVLYLSSAWMYSGMSEVMRKYFGLFRGELTVEDAHAIFQDLSWNYLVIIAPALAIPLFGAISYVLQNGLNLSTKPLEPDLKKLDPISGLKKIISLNSLAELVKSVLKVSVLTYVVYVSVKAEWENLPFLIDVDSAASVLYVGQVTFRIMLRTVWVIAAIAVIDYAFQRWNFEKGLRMTRQQIKEEHKETEGDPIVKARIKSMQRDMARKRMMQEVPGADVIVTNPTHIAVALKYDRSKSNAPVVVAKGAGLIAERIKEIARKHRVPVLENKPLARGLYKAVKVGAEVPVNMYKAVAEVLAYVYRLKGKGGR